MECMHKLMGHISLKILSHVLNICQFSNSPNIRRSLFPYFKEENTWRENESHSHKIALRFRWAGKGK